MTTIVDWMIALQKLVGKEEFTAAHLKLHNLDNASYLKRAKSTGYIKRIRRVGKQNRSNVYIIIYMPSIKGVHATHTGWTIPPNY